MIDQFKPRHVKMVLDLGKVAWKAYYLVVDSNFLDTSLEPANQDCKRPHMNRTKDSKLSNCEQKGDFW